MTPMIPSYDSMDDARLEEVLRERAFADGADLWVGRIVGSEWRAAYRVYVPPVGGEGEFTERVATTGGSKREALIALAQIDDIGTFG
jgi:hypothetical protein